MPDDQDSMDRSKPYPLGAAGSHRVPDLPIDEADDALLLFLLAVEEVRPEVVEELRDSVLHTYSAYVEELDAASEVEHPDWAPATDRENLATYKANQEALSAWQRRFHLDRWLKELPQEPLPEQRRSQLPPDGRFLRMITFVLHCWSDSIKLEAEAEAEAMGAAWPLTPEVDLWRESRKQGRWSYLLRNTMDKERWTLAQLRLWSRRDPVVAEALEALRPPKLPAYDPLIRLQSWTDYRAQVDEILNEYRRRAEAALAQLGGRKATLKENLDHFTWLARYQVCEVSVKDLADEIDRTKSGSGTPENSINRAIKRTADLFGLCLRVRPGRPRISGHATP